MNPCCYMIMLGRVAGGVSSLMRTRVWLPALVAVALSGLAAVAVALKSSVLPLLPGPLLNVETIAYSVAGAVLVAGALRPSGIRGRKAKGK